MKQVNARVLFLERPFFLPYVSQGLENLGIRLDFVLQEALGEKDVYKSSPEVCRKITELTESGEVGLVIIANNQYVGVTKAMAVAQEMKIRTIIAWTKYTQGDEEPYARLGFTRFGSRNDLPQMIADVLGVTAV